MTSLLFYAACFLLALLQHSAGDLAFDVDPTVIKPGHTKSLTVNCSFSFDDTDTLSGIISLIVSRSSQENLTGNFEELESLNIFSPDHVTEISGINATVSGEMNGNGESYLAIQWSYPTAKERGFYKCEANGMDFVGHPTSISQTVLVTSDDLDFQHLVDEVIGLRAELDRQEAINTQQSDTISMLQSQLVHEENIDKNQSTEIDALLKQTDELLSFIKNQSEIINSQQSLLNMLTQAKLSADSGITQLFQISDVYRYHVYLLSKEECKDVSESEKICEAHGGYLVEINDANEHQFVKNFLNAYGGFSWVVVSGTEEGHPGEWRYHHSGSVLDYLNRSAGEPGDSTRQCIELHRQDQWQMYDIPCSNIGGVRYMCEVNW